MSGSAETVVAALEVAGRGGWRAKTPAPLRCALALWMLAGAAAAQGADVGAKVAAAIAACGASACEVRTDAGGGTITTDMFAQARARGIAGKLVFAPGIYSGYLTGNAYVLKMPSNWTVECEPGAQLRLGAGNGMWTELIYTTPDGHNDRIINCDIDGNRRGLSPLPTLAGTTGGSLGAGTYTVAVQAVMSDGGITPVAIENQPRIAIDVSQATAIRVSWAALTPAAGALGSDRRPLTVAGYRVYSSSTEGPNALTVYSGNVTSGSCPTGNPAYTTSATTYTVTAAAACTYGSYARMNPEVQNACIQAQGTDGFWATGNHIHSCNGDGIENEVGASVALCAASTCGASASGVLPGGTYLVGVEAVMSDGSMQPVAGGSQRSITLSTFNTIPVTWPAYIPDAGSGLTVAGYRVYNSSSESWGALTTYSTAACPTSGSFSQAYTVPASSLSYTIAAPATCTYGGPDGSSGETGVHNFHEDSNHFDDNWRADISVISGYRGTIDGNVFHRNSGFDSIHQEPDGAAPGYVGYDITVTGNVQTCATPGARGRLWSISGVGVGSPDSSRSWATSNNISDGCGGFQALASTGDTFSGDQAWNSPSANPFAFAGVTYSTWTGLILNNAVQPADFNGSATAGFSLSCSFAGYLYGAAAGDCGDTISNLNLTGPPSIGIDLTGAGNTTLSDSRVRDVYNYGGKGYGFGINAYGSGGDCYNDKLTGNDATDGRPARQMIYGYNLGGCTNVTMTGNTASGYATAAWHEGGPNTYAGLDQDGAAPAFREIAACAADNQGATATIDDAVSGVYGNAAVGGGNVHARIACAHDGAAYRWIVIGSAGGGLPARQ